MFFTRRLPWDELFAYYRFRNHQQKIKLAEADTFFSLRKPGWRPKANEGNYLASKVLYLPYWVYGLDVSPALDIYDYMMYQARGFSSLPHINDTLNYNMHQLVGAHEIHGASYTRCRLTRIAQYMHFVRQHGVHYLCCSNNSPS